MNVDDDSVPFGSHELVWFQIVKPDSVYFRVKVPTGQKESRDRHTISHLTA
jgi:hypothetical protein